MNNIWTAPIQKVGIKKKSVKAASQNAPRIADRHPLAVALNGGRDASVLPGLTDYSILQLDSEAGTDLARWPTAKHFTAWLGLAPGAHQSGKRRGRQACQRNRAGRGGLLANQALAQKIATLHWNVTVEGIHFVEKGLAYYEQKFARAEQ